MHVPTSLDDRIPWIVTGTGADRRAEPVLSAAILRHAAACVDEERRRLGRYAIVTPVDARRPVAAPRQSGRRLGTRTIVAWITRHPGCTVSEIACAFNWHPASMQKRMTALARAGHVQRLRERLNLPYSYFVEGCTNDQLDD